MKILTSLLWASLLTVGYASPAAKVPSTVSKRDGVHHISTTFPRTYPADIIDDLRDERLPLLEQYLKNHTTHGCKADKVVIRREWTDLSVAERESYIDAVLCLQSLPSKTPSDIAPGARTRLDDFVVAHNLQTATIHGTANFLSWHRYYVWAHETALREECGYDGYQPYWNWDRYAADPWSSPLFNGNATSLGGDSVDGGCVETGPFKDMVVNIGPNQSLRHNPRCLKRSMSLSFAADTTADKTFDVITSNDDVRSFQDHMQTVPGIHGGGHFTVGGDPAGDVYNSPGDPSFFLHHGMIDRVWWIWQLENLNTRLHEVAGNTGGFFGSMGPEGTLDDDVHLGYIGDGERLEDLLNTMGGKGGEFCYIYY